MRLQEAVRNIFFDSGVYQETDINGSIKHDLWPLVDTKWNDIHRATISEEVQNSPIPVPVGKTFVYTQILVPETSDFPIKIFQQTQILLRKWSVNAYMSISWSHNIYILFFIML